MKAVKTWLIPRDRLTGRIVLQETRTTSTRNGAHFDVEMLIELAPTRERP